MKKLLGLVSLVVLFSSCGSSKPKKTTYKITDWVVSVPTSLKTWDCVQGWGRMAIYYDSVMYKDDTAANGDITKKKSVVTDTCYLIRVDSTGLPNFKISWSHSTPVLKDAVRPEYPIPARFLQTLYESAPKDPIDTMRKSSSIPKPVDSTKRK